jgi:pilus assembly protein FimV
MSTREQVVRVAEKYVAKGKIDAAIKEYLKVLKENANDVSTLNRLGDLYARISRIDEAVRLFTQIAEQYTEDGFLVKAIAIYKKIIKLDPTRLQVYENLAGLYHKQGLVNEARTQYQVLGDYYLKHNDSAAAISIYGKMAELEPDNPSHHLRLAELYQGGQLWEKALRSYRTIAELMLQHGRVEEAVRVYQRAVEVHSGDLGFISDAVMSLKDGGHNAAAARLLAAAVSANPAAEQIARLAGLRQATATPEVEPADDRVTRAPGPAERPSPAAERSPRTPPAPPRSDVDTRPPPATASASAPSLEQAPRPAPLRQPPPEPEPAPPPPLELPEEDVFVFDMDEAPSSLVAPPADMQEPGSAFQDSRGGTGPSADAGFEFELPELEMPELGEAEPLAEALPASTDEEMELPEVELSGWEPGDMPSAELELPPLEEHLAAPPAWQQDEDVAPLPWEEPAAALPGAAATPADEMEVELAGFELEEPLLEDAAPLPAWAQDPAVAPDEPLLGGDLDDGGFEIELEPEPFGGDPVAPVAPPTAEAPRLQDLLAEAEVFAKYGLEEKALERLDQVLAGEPESLDALQLLLDLQLRGGDANRARSTARRLRVAAENHGAAEVWQRARQKLTRAGVTLDGDAPAAATPAKPASEERVSELLKSLGPTAAPQRPVAPKKRSVDDALAELTSGVAKQRPRPAAPPAAPAPPRAAAPPAAAASATPAPAPPAPQPPVVAPPPQPVAAPPPPAAAAPPPAVAPPAAQSPPPATTWPAAQPDLAEPDLANVPPDLSELGDFEDELPDIVLPEERKPAAAELDDSSMDWLRDAPASKPAAAAADEKLFDEEDEFFDLAAELEEELGVEEGRLRGDVVHAEEPSLEEIVEGFKKGVAENLSPEDYDTHYNLGIAYREMGLLDEAIGEFQLAAKDDAHLVDCCSMLGVSFLEKGLPELAVKWYQRGLAAPGLKEEVMLSLLYDMGNVYMSMGDDAAAKKTFVELYGINSHYRDVVAKLEELGR